MAEATQGCEGNGGAVETDDADDSEGGVTTHGVYAFDDNANRRSCSTGLDFVVFLISRRSGSVHVFGLPLLHFGLRESKLSVWKSWIPSRTRSSLVNVTLAILVAGMPCAESRII